MREKISITGPQWDAHLTRAITQVVKGRQFLFAGDLDGDSVGSMVALALYLRLIDKQAHLILAEQLGRNLEFLHKIINFNSLSILTTREAVIKRKAQIDTVVFFDTANTKLVPLYPIIRDNILLHEPPVIEIDHHFGADSEEMTDYGTKLFRHANANTEIIAELLSGLKVKYPGVPDPFRQRNILIALITGMLWDTVGGQVIPYKEDYHHWIKKLGNGLKDSTWPQDIDITADNRSQKFGQTQDLLNYINWLEPEKQHCLDSITDRIRVEKGVACLNLLPETYPSVQNVCRAYDSDWFAELRNLLLNIVPEKSGKVGIVYFEGQNAEGTDCIFIKVRRAVNYSSYDLRKLEDEVRRIFSDNNYMGGGGHPGAVSFRIHPIPQALLETGLGLLIAALNHKLV